MIGNVSTNAITPIIFTKKFKINYEKDVVPVTRLVDIPAFLLVDDDEFRVKIVPELIAYAKKNPGKVRYGTVGVGSYPHYDMALFAKRAGDLDMIAHPQQGRRLRRHQRHGHRRHPGRVPQRRQHGAAWSRPASSSRWPWSITRGCRNIPTCRPCRRSASRTSARIAWQGMFAPAGTPKDVLETIFKRDRPGHASRRRRQEAFEKQNFNIVPNKSLDDAKTWLAGEIDTWRKITNEVKIERVRRIGASSEERSGGSTPVGHDRR